MSFLIIHNLCVIAYYDVLRYVDDNVTLNITMITFVEIPNRETNKAYQTRTCRQGHTVLNSHDKRVTMNEYAV